MSETDIPKCTSWRGHKFEARYSKGPSKAPTSDELFWGSVFDHTMLAEKRRAVTYERDICIRCGATVEKHIEIMAKPQAKTTV